MIPTLQQVFERAVERLSQQVTTYLPPLLVALLVLMVTYLVAVSVRWLLTRLFKGAAFDRFLKESGLASILGGSRRMRTVPLAAGFLYWVILLCGVLAAVDVFDTQLTTQIVQATVFLFPKVLTAGVILLAGAWLAQYLGRSALVWGYNEEMPVPRRLAAVVRVAVIFLAIVVAADVLDFAVNVFFAAFVIVVGGVVLTASLAIGLGAREAVQRYLRGRVEEVQSEEKRSLWDHL
jgi:hypothetical protein